MIDPFYLYLFWIINCIRSRYETHVANQNYIRIKIAILHLKKEIQCVVSYFYGLINLMASSLQVKYAHTAYSSHLPLSTSISQKSSLFVATASFPSMESYVNCNSSPASKGNDFCLPLTLVLVWENTLPCELKQKCPWPILHQSFC